MFGRLLKLLASVLPVKLGLKAIGYKSKLLLSLSPLMLAAHSLPPPITNSLSHHGSAGLATSRSDMDPDDRSVSRSIDTLNSAIADAVDQTIKPEDPVTPPPQNNQTEATTSLPKEDTSGGAKLRFDKPFLAAHSGKSSP